MANENGQSAVTIRLRKPTDLTTLVAVLEQVYALDGYPIVNDITFHDFIANCPDAWVAQTSTGDIVGHVGVAPADGGDLAVKVWREKHAQSDSTAGERKTSGEGNVDGAGVQEASAGSGKDVAVLKRLFVLPSARGSGIASKLIAAAVTEFQRRGQRLVLYVLEKDTGARGLYERLGWENFGTGVFRWGPGEGHKEGERGDEGGEKLATCFGSPIREGEGNERL